MREKHCFENKYKKEKRIAFFNVNQYPNHYPPQFGSPATVASVTWPHVTFSPDTQPGRSETLNLPSPTSGSGHPTFSLRRLRLSQPHIMGEWTLPRHSPSPHPNNLHQRSNKTHRNFSRLSLLGPAGANPYQSLSLARSSDAHRLPPPHHSYKTLPSASLLPPLLGPSTPAPAPAAAATARHGPASPWHEKMAACSRGLAWPPFDLTTARGPASWPRQRAVIRCCCAGADPLPRRRLSRAAAVAPERAEEWRIDGNKPSAAAPGRRRASLTAMPPLPFPAPRYVGGRLATSHLGIFVVL